MVTCFLIPWLSVAFFCGIFGSLGLILFLRSDKDKISAEKYASYMIMAGVGISMLLAAALVIYFIPR